MSPSTGCVETNATRSGPMWHAIYRARWLIRRLAVGRTLLSATPPWLALRHMSADLQKRFRELARDERVYVGGRFATQNDLCALFSVRAAHLYLRSGGRLALVLPLAMLTRGQFEQLRAGSFRSARIAWDEAWTMDDSVQPLFPVPSCAIFGRKQARSQAVPTTVRAYSGILPLRDAPEPLADSRLTVTEGRPAPSAGPFAGGSAYRGSFKNGATLYPRFLCLVERRQVGRLGANPSAPLVVSRRSNQEKGKWKGLPDIENAVEADFLRPILLGESILPYRVFRLFEAVVPVNENGRVLDSEGAANRGLDGLHGWMRKSEMAWNNGKSSSLSLVEQFDHYGKLGSQFPITPLRVVYSKAGSQPAACLVRESRGVVDHKLYWMTPNDEAEAHYLMAILNSETARARAAIPVSRPMGRTRL